MRFLHKRYSTIPLIMPTGWDKTNLFGRYRDWEIRLTKPPYETKTEK